MENSKELDIVKDMANALEMSENKEIIKEVFKYGRVPIVYGPTKSMLRKPKSPGLLSLIKNSDNVNEINNLLIKGRESYKTASVNTMKKWEIAAKNRINLILSMLSS